MKQFQCTSRSLGTSGPFDLAAAASLARSSRALDAIAVGSTWIDDDGDTWRRLPDLVLQDDVPLTAEDVTECRSAAQFAHDKLRLERIASAALQGLCANSYDGHQHQPLTTASYAEMAEIAVAHAKALIAELDKQP